MNNPIEKRIINVVAEILNTDPNQITVLSSRKEYPQWDSMQNLNIVLGLEQEFDVTFPPSDFGEIDGIQDLVKIILNLKD